MYQQPAHTWHTETQSKMATMTVMALEYIRDDARAAAEAGETFNNPKVGQYWDEYHYACMELHRRRGQYQVIGHHKA